jgi:hypothetical protein
MEQLDTSNQTLGDSGVPDFIIIGAAKCGTTSLHHILAQHERVFIPDREVHFFDVDDFEQHPDFFTHNEGFTFHDLDHDFDTYVAWYREFFRDARPGQLIGEDSTTYLTSKRTPARIARLLPQAKLVAMLRDPVARAYSHYWHNVRAGYATKSFEKTLRYNPGNLLQRGYYGEHLRRYQSFLDSGQLLVVFFEDFVADTAGTIERVCAHVGLEQPPDLSQIETRQNVGSHPWFLPGRLLVNSTFRPLFAKRRRIPNMPGYQPEGSAPPAAPRRGSLLDRLSAPLPKRKTPPMKPATRAFLEQIFRRENAGLSELLDTDIAERWPYMG